MDVTVNCPCGACYEFEIEPVEGRMPVEINCPKCGADGTQLANEYIEQHATASGPAAGLRMRDAESTAPVQTAPPPFPATAAPEEDTLRPFAEPRLVAGAIGAVVVGTLGMIAWYLSAKWTGYDIGIVAWGIGALVGVGTRALAKGCSNTLGLVAGVCAFVSIVGGEFLFAQYATELWDQDFEEEYNERAVFAKEAAQAKTDEQIRMLLAAYYAEDGEKPDPAGVSQEDIDEFRDEELPDLLEFAKGNPSRAEYKQSLRELYDLPDTTLGMLKETMGLFTFLWLFLGVGSAWRIASGRGGNEE